MPHIKVDLKSSPKGNAVRKQKNTKKSLKFLSKILHHVDITRTFEWRVSQLKSMHAITASQRYI